MTAHGVSLSEREITQKSCASGAPSTAPPLSAAVSPGTISTVTLGLSYMRPVRARGSVTVQARMEKLGRSVAFLNARVFDADGRLCVTATASFM